jgi:PAS domain S-box-containing protein
VKATIIKQKKLVELSHQMQIAPGNSKNGIEAEPTGERDLLRTLIDNLPDYIYVKDRESRFLINNLAHTRILGAAHPDELAGKTDFDYFPKELAGKYFADEQALMQSGQVLDRVESVVDNATGEFRWLQTTKIARRNGSGKVIGLLGISRDITEQKRAEEALRQSRDELEQRIAERTAQLSQERLLLRTLIDNLPDGVYAKDTAGRKTLANAADLKTLRCKTETEAIGKNDFDLFPKDIAEKFWADDQKVISGQSVINREEYFLDEEGRKRWLLTSKLPLRDQDGKIVGLIGIGRDITAIKEAEAKLEQVHKQLLETSRRAGMAEIATSVLHNVGNVLNSVNVASSCVADSLRNSKAASLSKVVALLREHEADLGHFITNDPKGKQLPGYLAQLAGHLAGEQADALDKLDRLQKNIEHIRDIVAMQQNYAKTSGVLESLPIVDLVEDAVRMNVGSMERHNIKMLREYSETPPVLVDKHKVLQILVNLISNAKHACKDSEKPDKQIIMRVVNEKERIRISVIDNGVGIPAENMTRIFNYGFTTRKDGHGFGLHNGALAAKEMGGSLAAFSEGPGWGATFTLELPLQGQKANL